MTETTFVGKKFPQNLTVLQVFKKSLHYAKNESSKFAAFFKTARQMTLIWSKIILRKHFCTLYIAQCYPLSSDKIVMDTFISLVLSQSVGKPVPGINGQRGLYECFPPLTKMIRLDCVFRVVKPSLLCVAFLNFLGKTVGSLCRWMCTSICQRYIALFNLDVV